MQCIRPKFIYSAMSAARGEIRLAGLGWGGLGWAGAGGERVGGGAVSPACVNTSDKDARSYSMGIIHDNIFTFGFTLISRDQVCLSL